MKMSQDRIPIALLALRIGVFIVMFMWALDKFVVPVAAWPMLAACFALYSLRDLDTLGVVDGRPKVVAKAQ